MPQDSEGQSDSILERLLRELQSQSEGSGDKNTRQLFTEVRDELRKLNDNLAGTQEEQQQDKEFDRLAQSYPALKTRPPRKQRPRIA